MEDKIRLYFSNRVYISCKCKLNMTMRLDAYVIYQVVAVNVFWNFK